MSTKVIAHVAWLPTKLLQSEISKVEVFRQVDETYQRLEEKKKQGTNEDSNLKREKYGPAVAAKSWTLFQKWELDLEDPPIIKGQLGENRDTLPLPKCGGPNATFGNSAPLGPEGFPCRDQLHAGKHEDIKEHQVKASKSLSIEWIWSMMHKV